MDFDAISENRSWATLGCEPTIDREGRDVAVVVARLAYKVSLLGNATVTFRPVRFGETADGHGALKFPADLVDEKPGTDVGLIGTAHPANAKPVEKTLAWIQAGTMRKVVTIYGPRRYVPEIRGIGPSAPALFEEPVPLRWDHCWGGSDQTTRDHEQEPFNPIGRGFAKDPKTLIGQLCAPLEPVTDLKSGPAPHRSHGCFAPIPERFEPRRALAGTHDAEWARTRAPIRPKDFNVAHTAWAVPGLHSEKPLPTDTPFEVAGVLKEGTWRFKLPRYEIAFESTLLGERRPHPAHLDSVLIDADERIVELTFRTSILLPRKWAMLEKIVAKNVGEMPEEALQVDDKERNKARAQGGSLRAG
jgi:hypothetical protein